MSAPTAVHSIPMERLLLIVNSMESERKREGSGYLMMCTIHTYRARPDPWLACAHAHHHTILHPFYISFALYLVNISSPVARREFMFSESNDKEISQGFTYNFFNAIFFLPPHILMLLIQTICCLLPHTESFVVVNFFFLSFHVGILNIIWKIQKSSTRGSFVVVIFVEMYTVF